MRGKEFLCLLLLTSAPPKCRPSVRVQVAKRKRARDEARRGKTRAAGLAMKHSAQVLVCGVHGEAGCGGEGRGSAEAKYLAPSGYPWLRKKRAKKKKKKKKVHTAMGWGAKTSQKKVFLLRVGSQRAGEGECV